MATHRSILIAAAAILTLGQGSFTTLQGQRATERFPPYLAHHEGTTTFGAAVAVGSVLGLSALVNIDADDSAWERRGVLAFTLPGAAVGGIAGLYVGGLAGAAVGYAGGGLLGGSIGESVGRSAEAGSGGAKGAIVGMSAVSVGAALLTTALFWIALSES